MSKRDLRSYFNASEDARISIPEIISAASNDVSRAVFVMAKEEVKKWVAKWNNDQNKPEKVQKKVGRYVLVNGKKTPIEMSFKINSKYDSKCTSVNTWKSKCKSNKESSLTKISVRPNLLNDVLPKKTKDIIIGKR